ncbi:MAG: protein kinase [Candidatus Obscuribacterales bacterium]|nr:protein kinase [Candidatus Obscuribacterales bacterium]
MAFDTVLGRNCAIKCLHEINRGEKQILRFQREARASSRLKHPGIAEIYDRGIAEDGAPYLVMEYVEGVSLLSYREDNGRLPIKQALDIVTLIADAMSHAHSNSVIQRDLKPSNIILTG